MTDELFLYDRDKGLFKEILKHSFVIEGRYHVSPFGATDLNTNNLKTLVADLPAQKYPICVCLTPYSKGIKSEEFYFTLLFLTTTYYDKSGTTNPNPRTRTSTHEIWHDWKDMKQVAVEFILQLENILRNKRFEDGRPLGSMFFVDTESSTIQRISTVNEDRVSGVRVSFLCRVVNDACSTDDYKSEDFDKIQIPDLIIHAQHKHE